MFRTRPFLALPQALFFARTASKLALGLFFLTFLLIFQPNLSFSSFKQSVVYAQDDQTQTATPAAVPTNFQLPFQGYLSNPFSSWHPAIDIAAGLGTPIHPIAAGTVIDAEYNLDGYGLMVVLDNGQGYQSLYAHMDKIYVQKGQQVSDGDILGIVGLTGRTTGPHTHLEISKDGVRIDPETVLPPLRKIPQASDFQVQTASESASESAQFVGGPSNYPSIQPKVAPSSTPAPTPIATPQATSTPIPTPTSTKVASMPQITTVVTKLDIETTLLAPTPPKPSFLSF